MMIGPRRSTPVDKLTWIGLAAVLLGWLLLLADLTIAESLLRGGTLVSVISLRSDVVTIAQTAILSGFGLAVIGVLRSGFGALNRFFETVLQRAASRPAPAAEPPEPQAPMPMATPMPMGPQHGTGFNEGPMRRPPPQPETPVHRPVASEAGSVRQGGSGPAKDRNYVILTDGSVEVETLLGTRVFASLEEARDFIR